MARAARVLAAAGMVAMLALAGCGRRGALDPPPDPRAAAAAPSGDAQMAPLRRPHAVPIKPPDQPFVLDPLL